MTDNYRDILYKRYTKETRRDLWQDFDKDFTPQLSYHLHHPNPDHQFIFHPTIQRKEKTSYQNSVGEVAIFIFEI